MVINLNNVDEVVNVKAELIRYCSQEKDLENVHLHITTIDNHFTPVLTDYAGLNRTYTIEELINYLLYDVDANDGGHLCIWCANDHVDEPLEVVFV